MTSEQIAELEKLNQEAMPPPWRTGLEWTLERSITEGWVESPSGTVIDYEKCGSHNWEITPADLAVLLAARNTLPRLLEERKRLLEAAKDRVAAGENCSQYAPSCSHCDAREAEEAAIAYAEEAAP